MLNDLAKSLIRSYVPTGVGMALAWLTVHFGIVVDEDSSTMLKFGAAGAVTAAYVTLARAVEAYWPGVGRVLMALGMAKGQPTYRDPSRQARPFRM